MLARISVLPVNKLFKYLRHSPLTNSRVANLHTTLSSNPVRNVLINLIDLKSITTLASNSLVIVTSSKDKYTLEDIINTNRSLIVSDPEIAPAGVYASQAIEKFFPKDFINRNVIFSGDVTYVSNILKNDKDLFGIVYNTEAIKNNLNVVYRIPTDYHDKIEYRMGILKNNDNDRIMEFLNILESENIKNKLSKLGFLIN